MLDRTVAVANSGFPEVVGNDEDGAAIVQFVYHLEIRAAEAAILPRGTEWRCFVFEREWNLRSRLLDHRRRGEHPIVRGEAPNDRQIVTGDVIRVDGIAEDDNGNRQRSDVGGVQRAAPVPRLGNAGMSRP